MMTIEKRFQELIIYDKFNHRLRVGCVEINLPTKRNGSVFCIQKGCTHSFMVSPIKHIRGYYIQVGKWGGGILWDSKVCYENT